MRELGSYFFYVNKLTFDEVMKVDRLRIKKLSLVQKKIREDMISFSEDFVKSFREKNPVDIGIVEFNDDETTDINPLASETT